MDTAKQSLELSLIVLPATPEAKEELEVDISWLRLSIDQFSRQRKGSKTKISDRTVLVTLLISKVQNKKN